MRRKLILLVGVSLGVAVLAAALTLEERTFGTPTTIVHVVAIKWKPEATDADKQKALEGVKRMAAAIPGIKNVWIKATRVQPRDYHAALVIEFEDRFAADAYVDHPAHREWESYYLPIRAESRSLQITNE